MNDIINLSSLDDNNLVIIIMMIDMDDPFQYLLAQKIVTNHQQRNTNTIRLNINKLPPDFFHLHQNKKLETISHRPAYQPNAHLN